MKMEKFTRREREAFALAIRRLKKQEEN